MTSESTMIKASRIRPTVKDLVAQPFFGSKPHVSPDCKKILYLMGIPNLKENSLDIDGYIYDIESETTHLLFRGYRNIKWCDNTTLCCLKPVQPSGNSQIHIFHDLIGEGIQITNHHSSVQEFEPFAEGFVFTSTKTDSKDNSRIGEFTHVESESSNTAVYYVSTQLACQNREQSRLSFKEEEVEETPSVFEITSLLKDRLHILSFVLDSEHSVIYLNCQVRSDSVYNKESSCFRIEFDPELILDGMTNATQEEALSSVNMTELAIPKGYKVRAISPDGNKLILIGRDPEHLPNTRPDLWLLDISKHEAKLSKSGLDIHLLNLTEKIDRYPLDVYWTNQGIYLLHWNESKCVISKIDESGDFTTFSLGDAFPEYSFTINKKGHIAFSGLSPNALLEIYYGIPNGTGWNITKITNLTEKYAHLDFGTVESIRWTSKDGTEIEGILRKPSDFDETKKYPLIIFPHGGPAASSPLSLIENDYFRPAHSLLARGILILQPNYRGGLGKGRAFMELNHDNLGVGDLWDIESGIDFLISQGFVDESKIGSMGGSQGGYLSAYAGMHTDRFTAVDVCSGVSSWYLYYISSDLRNEIHLTGTPYDAESRELYRKSAPISAIDKAKTPMLIQHGENDERISVISAKELYRALKHKGVPTELFTYPNKGHGFISPRENYAIMLQVYRWFCHYLLGEELDFFKDDF
jgi:dipeptidyl aminopeptidase/acylaminoacyl peptidase